MQKTARKINSKKRERVGLKTIHFAQISTKAKIHPLAKKFCKERRVIRATVSRRGGAVLVTAVLVRTTLEPRVAQERALNMTCNLKSRLFHPGHTI